MFEPFLSDVVLQVPAHLLALWDRQLLTAATQLARRRRHQGLSRTQVEGSDTVDEAAGQRSSAGTAKVGGRVEDVGFGLQLLFFIGVEWVVGHVWQCNAFSFVSVAAIADRQRELLPRALHFFS